MSKLHDEIRERTRHRKTQHDGFQTIQVQMGFWAQGMITDEEATNGVRVERIRKRCVEEVVRYIDRLAYSEVRPLLYALKDSLADTRDGYHLIPKIYEILDVMRATK